MSDLEEHLWQAKPNPRLRTTLNERQIMLLNEMMSGQRGTSGQRGAFKRTLKSLGYDEASPAHNMTQRLEQSLNRIK